MSVWDGPEDGPGTTDSLYVLYYLMPIAEELDLVDELHADRWCAERQEFIDEILLDFRENAFEPEREADDDEPDDDEDDASMTVHQVIGLLEHYLGAELMREDEDEAPDA